MYCQSTHVLKNYIIIYFQGNAGIGFSVLIIFITITVALMAALSAIGVCERCKMESGGVYFLLSHVLGARIGASVGIIYCFGQVNYKLLNLTLVHMFFLFLCQLTKSKKYIAVAILVLRPAVTWLNLDTKNLILGCFKCSYMWISFS